MSEKIYCGQGRMQETKYGDIPKIRMFKDDINTIVKWMKGNEMDFVTIDMLPKREPKEGKPTHYLQIDEWKPDPNYQKEELNDLPF